MPKVLASKKRSVEPLGQSERVVLRIGLALAVVFTIGLGVLLFALKYSGSIPDAPAGDANAVIFAPDYPRQLIDFSLTDQTGRAIIRSDFEGKYLVVAFMLSSCSVTCPVVSRQMEKIQALIADQPDVCLVTLTVDPVDDTVPVLKQFSSRFAADPSRWSFLTGDESAMRHLIGVSFLSPDTTGQFAYMPGNFAHIERLALVDPQGRVERYFNGLNESVADAVVGEINRLKKSRP